MCFCHEINKKTTAKGLYHGRVLPASKGKYATQKSPRVYSVTSVYRYKK